MSKQHCRINSGLHIWTLFCPSFESIKNNSAQSGCFNHWDLFGNTNVWIRVIPPSNTTKPQQNMNSAQGHTFTQLRTLLPSCLPIAIFFLFVGCGNLCSFKGILLVYCPRSLTFWVIIISTSTSGGTGIKVPYPKQSLSSPRTRLHNNTSEVASF